MSFQAINWAITQKVGNATGKLILLMLANYADAEGRCFPSQQTLARDCECTRRSVLTWLKKFEDMELLTRKRRHTAGGYRRSDLLCLNLSAASSHENNSIPTCKDFTAEPIIEPITSSLRSDVHPEKSETGDILEALNAYTEMASRCGLPQIRIFNNTRKRKLSSLLKNYGIQIWHEALVKIENSDFCTGRKSKFKADFDFIIQPQAYIRLLEGRYDNERIIKHSSPSSLGPAPIKRQDMWFDEYKQLKGLQIDSNATNRQNREILAISNTGRHSCSHDPIVATSSSFNDQCNY